eukprot:m.163588 g.163588  ORF g.163588 m.163588 type:complete len:714 (-) comp31297_c0_seq1:394-2535(-)
MSKRIEMCCRCNLDFGSGEEMVGFEGALFHQTCFKCGQCSAKLKASDQIWTHHGLPWCKGCHAEDLERMCWRCGTLMKMTDDGQLSGMKMKHLEFHPKCYVCNLCNKEFPAGERPVYLDGEIYCKTDAQAIISKAKKLPKAKWGVKCNKCKKKEPQPEVLDKSKKLWHTTCQPCKSCKKSLKGREYVMENNNAFCQPCADKKLLTKCVKCDQRVEAPAKGKVSHNIRTAQGAYHLNCFTCDFKGCPQVLFVGGKSIAMLVGKHIYCEKHQDSQSKPEPEEIPIVADTKVAAAPTVKDDLDGFRALANPVGDLNNMVDDTSSGVYGPIDYDDAKTNGDPTIPYSTAHYSDTPGNGGGGSGDEYDVDIFADNIKPGVVLPSNSSVDNNTNNNINSSNNKNSHSDSNFNNQDTDPSASLYETVDHGKADYTPGAKSNQFVPPITSHDSEEPCYETPDAVIEFSTKDPVNRKSVLYPDAAYETPVIDVNPNHPIHPEAAYEAPVIKPVPRNTHIRPDPVYAGVEEMEGYGETPMVEIAEDDYAVPIPLETNTPTTEVVMDRELYDTHDHNDNDNEVDSMYGQVEMKNEVTMDQELYDSSSALTENASFSGKKDEVDMDADLYGLNLRKDSAQYDQVDPSNLSSDGAYGKSMELRVEDDASAYGKSLELNLQDDDGAYGQPRVLKAAHVDDDDGAYGKSLELKVKEDESDYAGFVVDS